MKVVFAKLHCEHSDYLIANANAPQSPSKLCAQVCNRRIGAGADGVVFVQKNGNGYNAQQFNPNGELTTLCDGALRCVALFVSLHYTKENTITINNSTSGILSASLIETSINNISFMPNDIAPLKLHRAVINSLCEIQGEGVRLSAVQCGIPYAIIICHSVDYININAKGDSFQSSRIFQNGINIAFIQIVNNGCIKIKAYHYGCGQVPLCTNAAAAAAYVANHLSLCGKEVTAVFDNSAVNIKLVNNNATITATAHYVGKFEIEG